MSEEVIYLPIWVVAALIAGAQLLGYLIMRVIFSIFE